jgi:hypothetical protein
MRSFPSKTRSLKGASGSIVSSGRRHLVIQGIGRAAGLRWGLLKQKRLGISEAKSEKSWRATVFGPAPGLLPNALSLALRARRDLCVGTRKLIYYRAAEDIGRE